MEPPNSQSSPPAKYVALNDSLYDYIVHHRSRVVDPLLDALRRETESLGDAARMLISPEQGDFLTLLTKLLDVHTAVEIGTFTGYSSICIARGLVSKAASSVSTPVRNGPRSPSATGQKKESRIASNSHWEMPNRSYRRGNHLSRLISRLSTPTNPATTPISRSSCQR